MIIKKPIIYGIYLFLINYSIIFSLPDKLTIHNESNKCSKKLNNLISETTNLFGYGLLVHLAVTDHNGFCLSTSILKEMHTKWQVILTVANSDNSIKDSLAGKPDVYVMVVKTFFTVNQIHNGLSKLMNYTQTWNPEAKFLLMTTSPKYSKEIRFQLVKDTFNYLWKRNVFRTAIVMFEESKEELTLFSSSPYSNIYKTCKEISDPSQLQEVDLLNTQLSKVAVAGYSYKTPTSFYGCPLIAYTHPFPPYSVVDKSLSDTTVNPKYIMGMEIELVFLLAEIYNFSLTVHTAAYYLNQNAWIYILPNGTTVGMFQDLLDYKIDLSFAGIIPTFNRFYEIAHCYTWMTNSISWYVPGGEVIPSWRLVTGIFTTNSWLLLCSACIGFPLVYHTLSMWTTSLPQPEPTSLIMWRNLLGVSSHWTPKPSHLRILLFSWSLFSLHFTIMFTSRLLSLLAERPVEAGIRTIQELHQSRLKACMSQLYRGFYGDKTDGYTRLVVDSAMICNYVEDVMQQFLENRNFGILAKDDFMDFLIQLEKENIHRLKHKFFTYPVTMVVTKGSFLKKTLDTLIARVFNAGLFRKWLNNALRISNSTFISNPRKQKQKQVVYLEDLIWLFIILILGLTVSLLVFLLEFFYVTQNTSNATKKNKSMLQ